MAFNTETMAAIVRLVATLLAAAAAGVGLTVDAGSVATVLCCVLAAGLFAWSWWKNNNVTVAAQQAQDYLDLLRAELEEADE